MSSDEVVVSDTAVNCYRGTGATVDIASTASIILSFLGGGAVGAIWQTSQERSERFRQRMLDTADTFLLAQQKAEDAIEAFENARDRYRQSYIRTWKRIDELGEPLEGTEHEERAGTALEQTHELLGAALRVTQSEATPRALAELDEQTAKTRSLLIAVRDEEPQVPGLADWVAEALEHAQLSREMTEAQGAMFRSVDGLIDAAPRVRLMFAKGERDDPVTQTGFAIGKAMTAWSSFAVERVGDVPDDPASAEKKTTEEEATATAALAERHRELRAEVHRGIGMFASRVNARIRKAWL